MIRWVQTPDRATNDRQGFALLLVIWVLALLALIAAGVATDSTSQSVIARNRIDIAKARLLADSGVSLAIAGVLDTNRTTRWTADGRVRKVQLDGGSVTIAVQDEGGKIDLNDAPPALIGGLADEFRLDPKVRTALVQGVLGRRKSFRAKALSSTARVFRGVGMLDVARQPFADVSELLLLPGITARDYRLVAPYFTVYAQSATLNPMTATRQALLAVPGIGAQDVQFYLAHRGMRTDNVQTRAFSGVDRYVQPAQVHAVTITASATTSSGATFIRQAVALLTPRLTSRPYRFVRWQQLETERSLGASR